MNKREALGLVLILGMIGVVSLVAHFAGIKLCLFRFLTGYSCPCCGTTRACLSLLKGDFVSALTYNPLAVFLIFAGPILLWAQTLRKTWPRVVVTSMTFVFWVSFFLNWAYLVARDIKQV